jgi:hypothetical protein
MKTKVKVNRLVHTTTPTRAICLAFIASKFGEEIDYEEIVR